MSEAFDLFSHADSYPNQPGYKARDTAKEAAAKASPTSHILRAQCLRLLSDGASLTADEAASILGKSVLSCRPRFSELAVTGRIRDTGVRRANESGRNAVVWCLA